MICKKTHLALSANYFQGRFRVPAVVYMFATKIKLSRPGNTALTRPRGQVPRGKFWSAIKMMSPAKMLSSKISRSSGAQCKELANA